MKIFYADNATSISAGTALATSWVGPSITPLTNLNSGFRVYEVDSAVRVITCSKLVRFSLAHPLTRHSRSSMPTRELYTSTWAVHSRDDLTECRWRSDVNSYPALDKQTAIGPTYVYEYSTRAAYGTNIPWGPNDPLNATWWHLVTERASPLLRLSPSIRLF